MIHARGCVAVSFSLGALKAAAMQAAQAGFGIIALVS